MIPLVEKRTDPGKIRAENQDRMGQFLSPFGDVFMIADGMGGHAGGARAATMAVEQFEAHLKALSPAITAREALREAAAAANREIYDAANSGDPETAQMGTTVVLALLREDELILGHAGDSRAYLFRGGRLSRLTRDHSLVQKMLDHNMLTEHEARIHPDSSVITRAMGLKEGLDFEISNPLKITEGDGILLCTDGLSGYVDDDTIEAIISRSKDAKEVAESLLQEALDTGGEDNITLQLIWFPPALIGSDSGIDSGRSTQSSNARIGRLISPDTLRKCSGLLAMAAVLFWIAAGFNYFEIKRSSQITLAQARHMMRQQNKGLVRLPASEYLDHNRRPYNDLHVHATVRAESNQNVAQIDAEPKAIDGFFSNQGAEHWPGASRGQESRRLASRTQIFVIWRESSFKNLLSCIVESVYEQDLS